MSERRAIPVLSKRCSKCGKEKDRQEFNTRKNTRSGLRSECKICQRENAKKQYDEGGQREAKARKYVINREKRHEYFKAYYKKNKPKRKYDPAKQPARIAVQRAIKSGKLVRPSECQRCNASCKPQAHHHNGYEKPHRLDVVWLCSSCHALVENPVFMKRMEELNVSANYAHR